MRKNLNALLIVAVLALPAWAINYTMRVVCETPTAGKNFHYWRETNATAVCPVQCGTHPSAIIRDCVVEYSDEVPE